MKAAELNSPEHEKNMVAGAIRTDFILSAEIMAIALAEVADQAFVARAFSLAVVAIAITVGVYGAVGLIVKMDDIGLHLAERSNRGVRAIGRGLVHAMPVVMTTLSVVGIAAMIWVGGSILVHGLEEFGLGGLAHGLEALAETTARAVPAVSGLAAWLVNMAGAGLFGLAIGGVIVAIHHRVAPSH